MDGEQVLEEIHGTVEEITFRREDNGFTVMQFANDDELVTVVGILPDITEGEQLRLRGTWGFHPSFGRQFKVKLCERSMPSTAEDFYLYLASGAIKGIGPSTARKIIERFGDEAFDILENHPDTLAQIKGITKEKAKKMSKEFSEQFAVRKIMISLEKFSMTTTECLNAYKVFGANTVENIKQNPYILCSEGIGINFERADSIANIMPSSPSENLRNAAGIIHVIKHNLGNGHTCLPREKLLKPCTELLCVSSDTVDIEIDELISQKQLISEMIDSVEFIFLPNIFLAEKNSAVRITVMNKFPPAGNITSDEDIDIIEKELNITYQKKQRLAILTAMQKGLLILTGGPGTGKTTTLNGILYLLKKQKIDVALAAPTGRAAQRMTDITGKEAKTIHRLLEVEWDSHDRPYFVRNMRNPLPYGAVIVDELSMVDISLFSSLVDALPLGCRFIMVGDSDQLPAVGAGNVLSDLIASNALPVVELTEVFRQALESKIIVNAHKICNGEKPELNCRNNDFFFMERKNPENAALTVVQLATSRLPKAYNYSPVKDIQILCPSKKGETGTVSMNKRLQQILNPPEKNKAEFQHGVRVFRVGDKVMQIKNNYNIIWKKGKEEGTGIYNGDIGIIKNIDKAAACAQIVFDDKNVLYSFDSFGEIEHAYAMTVHKSQGNEFEAVIMPVVGIVPQLCYRNLLYTAVTRAKKLMIIVGNESIVEEMTYNNSKSKRYSALRHFLTVKEDAALNDKQ